MYWANHTLALRKREQTGEVVEVRKPQHGVLLDKLMGISGHALQAQSAVDGFDGIQIHNVLRGELGFTPEAFIPEPNKGVHLCSLHVFPAHICKPGVARAMDAADGVLEVILE